MTRPMREVDVPLPQLVHAVEHLAAVACLLEARARTSSPSDRIAYDMGLHLIDHPEACATTEDYPDWPAQFAAIQKQHSSREAS
jgi:hypothetical protein